MIEINKGIRRPKFIAKLLARDHLPGMLQQHRQNLQGLFLKLDLDALFA